MSKYSCRVVPPGQPEFTIESTTTRKAGGLDFTATGGKIQGHIVPRSLRVKPGAVHPVWKTQSKKPAGSIASMHHALIPFRFALVCPANRDTNRKIRTFPENNRLR
jgi:hypothetical protein